MQIAARTDHDPIQFAGYGKQLVGSRVEAGVGEEGIVDRPDLSAARVGHGCHAVGNVEDFQPFGHAGDAAAISDDAYA